MALSPGKHLVAFVVKAIDKRAAGQMAGDLFDAPEPVAGTSAAPTVSAPAPTAPVAAARPSTTQKVSKLKGVAQSVTSPGLGGLFDETLHPRAHTGMTTMNPETGKIIHGGQFAPSLNGGKNEPVNGSDRAGVRGEPEGESSDSLRRFAKKREARAKRADSAETVRGSGGLFDEEWSRPAGRAEQRDAGDNPDALDGRSAGSAGEQHDQLEGDGLDQGDVGDDRLNVQVDDVVEINPADIESAPEEEVEDGVHTISSSIKTGRDYIITDSDKIGAGSERVKFWNNIEAIRVVRKLQEEGRDATAEEQSKLVQYTGWGWAQDILHYHNSYDNRRGWFQEYKLLKSLMSDQEFRGIEHSVLNAHYTSPEVIDQIWSAVRQMGFTGGRVLEPSSGIGHFFGKMPPDLAAASRLAAVELDPTTAAICAQLYQSANVQATGFEQAALPDGHFDLAISNVPFGNYPVYDTEFEKPGKRYLSSRIHNYFFVKALNKVRDGGMIAFVTSTGTMDAPSNKAIRDYLSQKADFLGAIRLPSSAFEGIARTSVTTDVIFLRKRLPGEVPAGEAWTDSLASGLQNEQGKNLPINEYYARHPEMMCGTPMVSKLHGGNSSMVGIKGEEGVSFGEAMAQRLDQLPANVIQPAAWTTATDDSDRARRNAVPLPGETKDGGYAVVDGKLMQRIGDEMQDVETNATAIKRIVGMLGVRDRLREVHRTMLDPNASDEDIATSQQVLGAAYDAFEKKLGPIHSLANQRAIAGDPDYAYLCGLENWDPDTKTASKADIFTKRTLYAARTITNVATSKAALAVSLSQYGRLDFDKMAALTGKSTDQIKAELVRDGVAFHDPNGYWQESSDYLCGDVKAKLKQARAAAALDPARYGANVKALEEVQPVDIDPSDIAAKLGSGWIPPTDVQDFIHHILGVPSWEQNGKSAVTAQYIPHTGEWTLTKPGRDYVKGVAAVQTWGTPEMNAFKLIECALNMRRPIVNMSVDDGSGGTKRVIDREATENAEEKLSKLQEKWHDWLWSDDDRAERLGKIYNETFNCYHHREFDGSHLELPGLSDFARQNINSHVRGAVWRQLQSPNTLLAHAVGAGKTWSATIAAMEMRRLGIAKKPMVVVPNHLVGQWAKEMQDLYPSANILIATKKDLKKENRRQFLSRVANGDWDAVVIGHSSFRRVGIREERLQKHFQEKIDQLEAYMTEEHENQKGPTYKTLQKAKRSLEVKMQRRLDAYKKGIDESGMTFEDLGVDHLFVDEAHEYKNLGFVTKQGRLKGLSNSDSDKSFDMLMKIRHVQDTNGGRGLTFLTGTPISNSISEMHAMQTYLAPKALEEKGLSHFDSWAAQFTETARDMEATPTGEMKPTVRLSKFTNLPELSGMFKQFTDVLSESELRNRMIAGGTKLPKIVDVNAVSPMSEFQRNYIGHLAERAKELQAGGVDPHDDNMLKITSEGRKNSLDPRLLDPTVPEHPRSKLNMAADMMFKEWSESHDIRGTQIAFMDMGTPKVRDEAKEAAKEDKNDRDGDEETEVAPDEVEEDEADVALTVSLYKDLKDKLVAKGVPSEQIAFIHDAKTDEQKLKLFQDIKAGRVRFLFGSTAKCGTGMNVQDRMTAIHHLDCPWRPSDVTQRDGRVFRKGNINDEVRNYKYVGAGTDEGKESAVSFDAFTWQLIKSKAQMIDQMLAGDPSVRTSDDTGNMIMKSAELIAIASGNPLLLERSKLENEIQRLTKLRQAHAKTSRGVRGQIKALPGEIEDIHGTLARMDQAIAFRDANKLPEGTTGRISVNGVAYEKTEEGAEAFLKAARDPESDIGYTPKVLGTYNGWEVAAFEPRNPISNSKYVDSHTQFMIARSIADAQGSKKGEWHAIGDIGDATPKSMAQRFNRAIGERLDNERMLRERRLGQAKEELEQLQALETEFPHEAKYHEHRARMEAIDKELGTDKEDETVGYDGPGEDDEDGGEAKPKRTPKPKPLAPVAATPAYDPEYDDGEPDEDGEPLTKSLSRVNGQWSGATPTGYGTETPTRASLGDRLRSRMAGGISGVPHIGQVLKNTGATLHESTVGRDSTRHTISAEDGPATTDALKAHLAMRGFKIGQSSPAAPGTGPYRRADAGTVTPATAPNGETHEFHVQGTGTPGPRTPGKIAFVGKLGQEPKEPKEPTDGPKPAANPALNVARGALDADDHRTLTGYTGRILGGNKNPLNEVEERHMRELVAKRGVVGSPSAAASGAAPAPTVAPAAKPATKKRTPAAIPPADAAPAGPKPAATSKPRGKVAFVSHPGTGQTPSGMPAARAPKAAAKHAVPAASPNAPAATDGRMDMKSIADKHNMTIHDEQHKSVGHQEEHAYLMSHANPSRGADSLYRRLEKSGMAMSPLTYDRQQVDGRLKHVYKMTATDKRGNVHRIHIVRPRHTNNGTVAKVAEKKTRAATTPSTPAQLARTGKR